MRTMRRRTLLRLPASTTTGTCLLMTAFLLPLATQRTSFLRHLVESLLGLRRMDDHTDGRCCTGIFIIRRTTPPDAPLSTQSKAFSRIVHSASITLAQK